MSFIEPSDKSFDYNCLSREDRDWLLVQTGIVKTLSRSAAESVIRIGMRFNEVKQRIGHGKWLAWAQSEFPWNIRTVQRFIQVAQLFSPMVMENTRQVVAFDPSALYALCESTVSQSAREYALELARDGQRVTHRLAREIIAEHKKRYSLTPQEVRQLAPLRDVDRRKSAEPVPERFTEVESEAYFAIRDMLKSGGTIHVMAVMDAEISDDIIYEGRYYCDEDRPRSAARTNLEDCLLALADRERKKPCASPKCHSAGKPLPLSNFARDSNNPDGRLRYCQQCERARISDYKKRKKQGAIK